VNFSVTMRRISALASDPSEARRIRRRAITPCTSAAKRPASIKLRPEVEHAHILQRSKKEPGAAAPGSCYGRRIALCCAFSFGCLPERAPASDKRWMMKRFRPRQEHRRILHGILACSAAPLIRSLEVSRRSDWLDLRCPRCPLPISAARGVLSRAFDAGARSIHFCSERL
jgi:hypothetical protein